MSTESWEDTMRALRAEFVREAHARADEMDRLLSVLAGERSDRKALQDLMRAFHSFTGSGTTHGFPQITALGRQGEQECTTRSRAHETPSATDIEAWRRQVVDLRSELVSPTEPASPPVPAAARRQPRSLPLRSSWSTTTPRSSRS